MNRDNSSLDLFPEQPEISAEYWKVALAGLIDAAFAIFCILLLFRLQTLSPAVYLLEHINSTLLVLLWLIIYRFITITIFNATLGMLLFRIKFLNGDKQPLSLLEIALAALFILYAGTRYYKK